MTGETIPSGLWQETRRAAQAWGEGRGPRDSGPAGPSPALAGQVLVLPELNEPRLAWAVLRREAAEEGRLLLVAADVNPLVGSGDVAATGPGIGALTLRCRFAVRASEGELGAATLLGTLPPEALSRAESRRRAVEAGRAAGTFTEQETEEDPEYREWIEEVVRPAAGRLEERAGAAVSSPLPALPFPTPRPAEPRSSRRAGWLRWAAVLACVGLSAGGGFLWWRQAREIADLQAAATASEAGHRQAIAALEARREELEARYRAELQKAGADRQRLEAEHRARLAEVETKLDRLRQAIEVRNPMISSLDTDTRRGAMRLIVAPEVSHLVLLLPVRDPTGTEFVVEISERSSGEQVLVQKGLRVGDDGEVRLGLPAVLLPPGDYRLRLYRKDGGKLNLVREHAIDIDREPGRRLPPR